MELPPPLARLVPGEIEFTPPVVSLIIANLVTILLAVIGNWDVLTVIFIFWAQSLIIGFFSAVSLLFADTGLLAAEMGKAGAEAGRPPVMGRGRIWIFKIAVSGFFCVHYGLFHLFYFILYFWNDSFSLAKATGTTVLVPLAFFSFHHLFSLLWSWRATPKGGQFMADSILLPYNRIVPMHLTMFFGFAITALLSAIGFETLLPVLVVFLALKTYMDIRMHIVLHERQEHPEKRDSLFVWI
ncbi:MAG: DUF6498-containing protein [Methanoregula sp.]|nr:DUF6498-containing protein [Methanoregula sp.]